MKIKGSLILHIILSLSFFYSDVYTQDYAGDSAAVRAILDSGALYNIRVDQVSDSSNGRIVRFCFGDHGVPSLVKLPVEIGVLTGLISLDIAGTTVRELPAEITNLTNLKTLRSPFSCLSIIPAEIGGLTSLDTLDLSISCLEGLPDDISALTPTHLDVSRNHLDPNTLPGAIVTWLDTHDPDWRDEQHITYKDDSLVVREILDSNGLQGTTVDALTDTSNGRIVSLNITRAGLTYSDCSRIYKLNRLEKLWLDSNGITQLCNNMAGLTRIKDLNFSLSNFTFFPHQICAFSSLETLNLKYSSLSSLHPQIRYLINLTTLNLRQNELTEIEPGIFECEKLSSLDLYNNKLASIPGEIGNLTNLTSLNVARNNLQEIPVEIENCTELSYLNLQFTSISEFPAAICKLTNLSYLNTGYNYLGTLPDEIGNLVNIKELDMVGCKLTSLPETIIKLAPSVYLDMGFNSFDTTGFSDTLIAWLDTYDPDWRNTNNVPIISNSNSSLNQGMVSVDTRKSTLVFTLPVSGNSRIQIFDMKGKSIGVLVDSYKQAGRYHVNLRNKGYCSGTYFLKLRSGRFTVLKKFTIIN